MLTQFLEEIKISFDLEKTSLWEGSPYLWVRQLSLKHKGTLGEKLAKELLRQRAFNIEQRSGKDNDFIVNHKYKFENKFSSLNEDGTFKWLSIRIIDDYDTISLVGFYPTGMVRLWTLPKHILLKLHDSKQAGEKVSEIGYSNGGKNHASHLYIKINPETPPDWLVSCEVPPLRIELR